MKTKKIIVTILCVIMIASCCVFFAACDKDKGDGDNGGSYVPRDSKQWFTEEELAKKGLSALPAPTGLSGEMSSDVNWFNDGYAFSQVCPDEDTFKQNAEVYFNYFKENYDGRFGVADFYANTTDFSKYYYKIRKRTNLSDYFDDNPSPMYTFYFVTDTTLDGEYLKSDAVWTLEVRFESGKFKLFVENANQAHNGQTAYYYKMA